LFLAAASFALHDDLNAVAMLSAQRRAQTWQQGRLPLSPTVHRRLTTLLDWRLRLPGTQTYAGRRLPGWQAYFGPLQVDADVLR
jgi:hypothetical protein